MPSAKQCTLTSYSATISGSEVTLDNAGTPSSAGFTIALDSGYKKSFTLTANFSPSLTSSISVEIVVCGAETLTASASSHDLLLNKAASTTSILSSTYTAFYTLTTGVNSHASCVVNEYKLCTDSACSSVYTHASISLANTINSPIVIDQSTGFAEQSFYLVASTNGLVTAAKQIKVEVCGHETISLS